MTAAKLELVIAQQNLDKFIRTGAGSLAEAWVNYQNAQAEREEAERDWEALDTEEIEDRLEDAKVEVVDAEEALEDAQEEFDKFADFDEDNNARTLAEDDLEEAQEDYNEAMRQVDEIQREYDSLRAALDAAIAAEAEALYQYDNFVDGVNADDLEIVETRLENAQAQVSALEALVADYKITAPVNGVIASVLVLEGEYVASGSTVVSLVDPTNWIVKTTDVSELEIVKIGVGQQVVITPDALTETVLRGLVSEIEQSPTIQGGDVFYTVEIQVEDVPPLILWGMTVELEFERNQ